MKQPKIPIQEISPYKKAIYAAQAVVAEPVKSYGMDKNAVKPRDYYEQRNKLKTIEEKQKYNAKYILPLNKPARKK